MKQDRKWIESAAVVLFTAALSITAVFTNDTATEKNTMYGEEASAGVAQILSDYEKEALSDLENVVSVQREETQLVTAGEGTDEEFRPEVVEESTDEESQPAAEEETEEPVSAELAEWQNYLMADVNESLNVRAEASEDAELVGKLRKGDLATVLEKGSEWTKITSGNVNGYVKNDYCVFGSDAYAYAVANCDTVATALTGGLRIRSEQSTEAEVVKALGEGDTIVVDTSVVTEPGWVAVLYNSKTYYVSAEYVEVELHTGTGITMEEEAAARAAEEAAKAKAAASQVASAGTVQGSSLAASADETTLLAAIIQCEAGNQSYECQLAVGAVVVNRVKSGSYPGTIYDVIYQKSQFGPASSGVLESRLSNGVSQTAYSAAAAALAGEDNTAGAMHFKNTSSGHAGTAIGALVFY
jgi:spore germination cell wall hydrolase CwlJ-like protein